MDTVALPVIHRITAQQLAVAQLWRLLQPLRHRGLHLLVVGSATFGCTKELPAQPRPAPETSPEPPPQVDRAQPPNPVVPAKPASLKPTEPTEPTEVAVPVGGTELRTSDDEELDETAPPKFGVMGALDHAQITLTIHSALGKIRSCYTAAQRKDPSLEGTVKIKFEIATSGRVGIATVTDTTVADASVGNCVAKTIKKLRFPKNTRGKSIVVYPFVFDPA